MATLEELNDLFRLDAETGRLFWRKDKICGRGRVCIAAGTEAGWLRKDGYRQVEVNGQKVRTHRVVWQMIHGYAPILEIDHINRIRSDNRPCNLREASSSENKCNKGTRSDNALGISNISKTRNGRYAVDIISKGVHLYRKNFEFLADAVEARNAALKLHHGAFAKTEG